VHERIFPEKFPVPAPQLQVIDYQALSPTIRNANPRRSFSESLRLYLEFFYLRAETR
jgi:hypothetical protein